METLPDKDDAVSTAEPVPDDCSSQGQPQQHAQWLESKSNMLDEVSHLVDMMSSEKATLSDQLTTLKVELEGAKGQIETLEGAKLQLEDKKNLIKSKLKEVKQKHKQETVSIKDALENTKKQLEVARNKLSMLSTDLEKKHEENDTLGRSHCELMDKVKTLEVRQTGMKSTLGRKSTENTKLNTQLSSLREHYKSLCVENSVLQASLTTAQERHKHSQDDILALKGRLTSAKKSKDQFQIKCTTLEKMVESLNSRSPAVVKVATRSREELRLAEECKRKDDLLASCLKEATSAQSRNELLQRGLDKLHSKLNAEKRERLSLQTALEAKEKEWETSCKALEKRMLQVTNKLEDKEKKESDYVYLKSDMEDKIQHIDHDLKMTRRDLHSVREEVRKKEEMWSREKAQLELERKLSREQLTLSRDKVEKLEHELETAQQNHQTSVDTMSQTWERQLSEGKEDYRRMKEASTKRCTELAKEVWKLKLQVEEQ